MINFTNDHRLELIGLLNAPYVSVSLSTLGGQENSALMLTISLDPKEAWANGILQNSRYAHFSIDSADNKVELFSGGYKLNKFRKTAPIKSILDAAEKIQKWIDSNLQTD